FRLRGASRRTNVKHHVAVIGAGNVGASAALYVAERGLADVTLIDIVEGMPQGKALDLLQATPLWRKGGRIQGASDLAAVAGADVQAMVLGGHGDSLVPLPRFTTVAGVPITELIPAGRIAEIVQHTRDGGAEIVKLLKTGSAYYAPAMCAVEMVEAILTDQKRLVPCSVSLNGEYGLQDLFIGVPIILGGGGVERIIQLKLSA